MAPSPRDLLISLIALGLWVAEPCSGSQALGPTSSSTTFASTAAAATTSSVTNNNTLSPPAFVRKAELRGGDLLKTKKAPTPPPPQSSSSSSPIRPEPSSPKLPTAAKKASLKQQQQQPVDPLLEADYIADTQLPTDMGNFRMRAYRVRDDSAEQSSLAASSYSNVNAMEPIVIYAADKPPFGRDGKLLEHVPVRIHDQCLTSEVFRSRRCDCKEQLKLSMDYVQQHGGAVIYLQQEGRGIGLANKVAAYQLQDDGYDTVDANLQLGFPDDARQYGVLPAILADMGIQSIRLMTNNPRKVHRLTALGIAIVDTIPILAHPNRYNRKYLETKADRMSHTNFGHILANDVMPAHGMSRTRQGQHQMPTRNILPNNNNNNRGMVPRQPTTTTSTAATTATTTTMQSSEYPSSHQ